MVGVGVWALLRWLTYILMAMATVWRRGRDVEEAPSRRSGGQVGSGRPSLQKNTEEQKLWKGSAKVHPSLEKNTGQAETSERVRHGSP